MPTAVNRVIGHLRRAAFLEEAAGATDAELLDRYVAERDEGAFEALLQRHGPMVLGVCRRVLGNEADAHDAFQATFLVLVRKAGSLRARERVANWLHGVAHNTARKAKERDLRRREKERQAATVSKREAAREVWGEVRALLDAELGRLPEYYRTAIVVCALEGRTLEEAARHLGWPRGTVATRLTRGRDLLARRLAQRGLALSGPVLTAVLAEGTANASGPPALTTSTVRAAGLFTVGTEGLSPAVASLTHGVLKAMSLNKLQSWAAALVALVALGALLLAAGPLPRPTSSEGPTSGAAEARAAGALLARPPERAALAGAEKRPEGADDKAQAAIVRQLEEVRWNIDWVDAKARTVRVSDARPSGLDGGHAMEVWWLLSSSSTLGLDALPVTRGARVTLDGREVRLEMLVPGTEAKLRFGAGKAITVIDATSRRTGHVLKKVDADKGTISVTVGPGRTLEGLPVAGGATIHLLDKAGPGKLADLEAGMRVSLRLRVEKGRVVVADIRARK